jgi:hypothetical protein
MSSMLLRISIDFKCLKAFFLIERLLNTKKFSIVIIFISLIIIQNKHISDIEIYLYNSTILFPSRIPVI